DPLAGGVEDVGPAGYAAIEAILDAADGGGVHAFGGGGPVGLVMVGDADGGVVVEAFAGVAELAAKDPIFDRFGDEAADFHEEFAWDEEAHGGDDAGVFRCVAAKDAFAEVEVALDGRFHGHGRETAAEGVAVVAPVVLEHGADPVGRRDGVVVGD